MSWRRTLIDYCGPGQFTGIAASEWYRLLGANHFRVAPSCWLRASIISLASLQNSCFRLYENWRFGARFNSVVIYPPVFILGHWRSGTTYLYRLFANDRRFAYPNLYQAAFPHTFLTTERSMTRVLGWLLPRTRADDQVTSQFSAPHEDEVALGMCTLLSPSISYAFPRQRDQYDKYLTFRDVPRPTVEHWKHGFRTYLNKLTWKYDRPLFLKSPAHTGRIRLLLEMFPDAKFVHIHRNPYTVFQSTQRLIANALRMYRLQSPPDDLDDWILNRHSNIYRAFFEDRELIRPGHFHEIAFADLERDPVGQVRRAYEALALPDFEAAAPAVQSYVDSVSSYERNSYAELPAHLLQRISSKWGRCFDEWGYPKQATQHSPPMMMKG